MQIEFGEKLKKCREEKGMTQQTLADRLYVTRQAVSRWECGARYPDLLTAKRISEELEISLDELVSGEKYVRDIEKEPVITASVPLLVQTALYAAACIPFLLMCFFIVISVIPRSAEFGLADEVKNIWTAEIVAYNFVYLVMMGIGLYYSVCNELSPRRIGWILSICLWMKAILSSVVIFRMLPVLMKGNGTLTWDSKAKVLFDYTAPFIILGFFSAKNYLDVKYIYAVVAILAIFFIRSYYWIFQVGFDIGLSVNIIHVMGDLAYLMLLAFQAYTLNRKRAAANL